MKVVVTQPASACKRNSVYPGVSRAELKLGEALVGLQRRDRIDGSLDIEAIDVGHLFGDGVLGRHG